MKRLCFLTAILCLSSSANATPNTVKIGAILTLSGQYAAVGADNQQGIEIAKSEIPNANRLEFVFADSKAEPLQAVTEFKKLVEADKISGAFIFRGPPGMAVNPLSHAAKMPLLGGVGNKNFALGNPYAFQLWVRSDEEGTFLADHFISDGAKKIAVVTVQDDWPVAVSDGFRDRLKTKDIQIVFNQDVLPSETDLKPFIAKLKAAAPDAIFLNVGLNQVAPFIRQLKEMRISAKLYSNFFAAKKEVLAALGEAAEGLRYAEMSTDMSKLKEEVKNRFNSSPSGATLASYVATILLSQAITDLGDQQPTSENLYNSLLKQTEIRTQNGVFAIKDRFIQFPMVIRQITNSSVQTTK